MHGMGVGLQLQLQLQLQVQLKCKTLGGIHMQSTADTSVVYILRMRVRVPRCPA